MTMKFFLEENRSSPAIRTHSLYDIHDRIDYFEKRTSYDDLTSSSSETLQSVLANSLQQTYHQQESYGRALSRTMLNTSAKLAKYPSLSTMNDGKRSQRYSSSIAKRVRAYSLGNAGTMAITATTSFSEEATIESQETASGDYENTYFYPEETTRVDDVLSLTSVTSNGEKKFVPPLIPPDVSVYSDTILFQSDSEESSDVEPLTVNERKSNGDEQQRDQTNFTGLVHATKYAVISDDRSFVETTSRRRSIDDHHPAEEEIQLGTSIVLATDDDDDEDEEDEDPDRTDSESNNRYTAAGRNSCASDDLNNTSSTLRQEAISITKVRCKRRKTWIRSDNENINQNNNNNNPSPNCYSPVQSLTTAHYLTSEVHVLHHDHLTVNSNKTIEQVHSRHSSKLASGAATMLLHNGHTDDEQNVGSTYDIIVVNADGKDTHPSSSSPLSPVKRLFNESIDSNIEIIQMDEEECVLEIVDGVLTIVPKEKSSLHSTKTNPLRASSVASSMISSPSLSELEHEREDLSLSNSSKISPPTDELDLFSSPLVRSNPSKKKSTMTPRASSPIHQRKTNPLPSPSIKDSSPASIETQTRSNKSNVLSQLLQSVKKIPAEKESQNDYPLPKSDPPPVAKPINKARINEFASLLSSSVHLTAPSSSTPIKKPKTNVVPTPVAQVQLPSTVVHSDHRDHEEQVQVKKHIDARYNERIDDRKNIQVKTANIKALFEEKISSANRTLSQSTDHLAEQKVHRKSTTPSTNPKRTSISAIPMTKTETVVKDVVIEEKSLSNGHGREEDVTSTRATPPSKESLIEREIRLAKEKEEELKRQRKKCGLPAQAATTEASVAAVVGKSSSFLSNLDFFASKANGTLNESSSTSSSSPRRSISSNPNSISESHSTIEEPKLMPMPSAVSQGLHRFNDQVGPALRPSSHHLHLPRSTSNQNLSSANPMNNIIQREIEATRAKEAELRELGRIQHTSDEHSDPRKYHEHVTILPKSQSSYTITNGKHRRDSENQQNSRQKGKTSTSNSGVARTKGVMSNGTSSSVVKSSLVDRIQYEKRQCQKREEELKQQRYLISGVSSSANGDSGHVSPEEHDDDQERYFDKIERIKRTETEKAQAPLVRPTKKHDLSQKWEQIIASRF